MSKFRFFSPKELFIEYDDYASLFVAQMLHAHNLNLLKWVSTMS